MVIISRGVFCLFQILNFLSDRDFNPAWKKIKKPTAQRKILSSCFIPEALCISLQDLISWFSGWCRWFCRVSQWYHLLNTNGKTLKEQKSCLSLPAANWRSVTSQGLALSWLRSVVKGALAKDGAYVFNHTAPHYPFLIRHDYMPF